MNNIHLYFLLLTIALFLSEILIGQKPFCFRSPHLSGPKLQYVPVNKCKAIKEYKDEKFIKGLTTFYSNNIIVRI
jgi:hypothetical protein